MSSPFQQVPALPVVIPLGVVLFVLLVWRLRHRGLLTVPRAAVAAALAVYAAGIVANTIFPIHLDKPPRDEDWTPGLALIPFHDYEIEDALTNVVIFIPLGILIALVLARPTWLKVIAVAAATSLVVELSQLGAQYFVAGGHIADVNDFLSNVVGGAVGYGVVVLLALVPGLGRFIDLFRWRPVSYRAASEDDGAATSR